MTKPVSALFRSGFAGRAVLLALLALSAASLSACNTVEGAGADVSSLGRGVTGAASGTKAAITP